LLAVAAILTFHPAHGQSQTRTAPIDPAQIEKRFDAQQERHRLAKPPIAVPRLAVAPRQADTHPLFVLKVVALHGVNALSEEALRETYDSLIGRRVSQADLLGVTEAITNRYRAAGFHLSRAVIPPQDLKRGRLRIDVVEGFVTDLEINGDDNNAFGVRQFLEPLLLERPSRLATVERQLLLVNDIPGARVADIALDELGQTSGRFRLSIRMKSWRLYASASLDNSGTRAVGPLQTLGTVAANSSLVPGDSASINLSTVPDATRELRYGRLSYDMPIGVDGIKIGGSISHSAVWPGDNRRTIDDRTINQAYELRGSIAALQTRKFTALITASANWSDPYETTSYGDVYRDHVRQVSLALDLKFQDPSNAWNYLGVAARQGVNAFGATRYGDPNASREDAAATASILSYSFARYQPLVQSWSMKAIVTGQYASGPLLTSQSYFLSGAAFGPGYFSGDHGYSGSVELRFDQVPDLSFFKGYQLYTFVDGGQVWNSGGGSKLSLASAGVGLRALITDELSASIAVAMPVHYTSRTDEIGRARVLFSISNVIKWCPNAKSFYCV
jgi:hemolysin activation/secretion protein